MSRKTLIGIAAVVLAIPALVLAYWLFSPYFIDEEVNEEFPYSANADIPGDMTQQEAEDQMVDAASAPDTDSTEPMPEAMEDMPQEEQIAARVSLGSFTGRDAVHQGEGQAIIYALPDGTNVLRFEDFRVTNGPDLHVLVSPDGSVGSATDLGELKGNVGNQNYELPADLDPASLTTVIIYCDPFRVIFSTAQLAAPDA
jgi:hypothetical protein